MHGCCTLGTSVDTAKQEMLMRREWSALSADPGQVLPDRLLP
jgi:hypothetical protein